MIPSSVDLALAHRFLARPYGVTARPDPVALEAVVAEALALAAVADDEPAALFYAIARHPLAMPGVVSLATARCAANLAAMHGRQLRATAAELNALCVRVGRRTADFEHVRTWFAARLVPRAG